MSENLKLRLDHGTGETQQDRLSRAADPNADTAPIDEAESQMRKALGLLGEGQRHRPDSDRIEQPNRGGDRFGGGLHRRRFVQDGDIPVTVLRRDQGHEPSPHRGVAPVSTPSSSRLQRTEAALAAETAAREKAERSLAETLNLTRDLQTKIGHAELARHEATEALRQEREAGAQLRAEFAQVNERLEDVLAQMHSAEQSAQSHQSQMTVEREARKAAEKSLRVAEAAREAAEQLARTLTEESSQPRRPEVVRRPRVETAVVAAGTKRPRASVPAAAEPEPVKWWLTSKPAAKRR